MRLLKEIATFKTVKSKVIISLFETVRLSVSISLRNLYNSLNSMKEMRMVRSGDGAGYHFLVVRLKSLFFDTVNVRLAYSAFSLISGSKTKDLS